LLTIGEKRNPIIARQKNHKFSTVLPQKNTLLVAAKEQKTVPKGRMGKFFRISQATGNKNFILRFSRNSCFSSRRKMT